MNAHDRRAGTVARGDFDQCKRIGDIVGTGSFPFLGHQHAHEPESGHGLYGLGRKPARSIPFSRIRQQLLGGEAAGRVPYQSLFFAEEHAGFRDYSSFRSRPDRLSCQSSDAALDDAAMITRLSGGRHS